MNATARLTGTPGMACILYGWMAALLAATAHASVVDIPATISGYVLNCYNTQYAKVDGHLAYGRYSNHSFPYFLRAYLKFSMDTLPDTCAIVSVELDYYQYRHDVDLPEVNIRLMPDPIPLEADHLYWVMDTAMSLTQYHAYPDGWVEWRLDSAGALALDSCRRTGSVSLGVHFPSVPGADVVAHAYGYTDPEPPYLRIEYTSSGTGEAQGTPASQREFTLAPNPTTGKVVTVMCALAVGKKQRLAIRNAAGRTVRTFLLEPTGIAHLDLHGLAPGVYMATLEGGTQSLTRKLVLTAR